MLCSEACLVNHGLLKFRAVTLRCNCWSCEICIPRRKARLVSEVADGLPTKLMTLTTRAVEGGDPVAEARRQGDAFAALVRLIKKRCRGEEFAFFAVREATKRGWPHLHVAMRAPFLSWRWLSENWDRLSGSPGVDIRKVNQSTNAAKYLAKYIGKEPHRFGSTKRYWCSRNWRDVVKEREFRRADWDSRWFIVMRHIGDLAEGYWLKRWEVTMEGRFGFFEARAPPC